MRVRLSLPQSPESRSPARGTCPLAFVARATGSRRAFRVREGYSSDQPRLDFSATRTLRCVGGAAVVHPRPDGRCPSTPAQRREDWPQVAVALNTTRLREKCTP